MNWVDLNLLSNPAYLSTMELESGNERLHYCSVCKLQFPFHSQLKSHERSKSHEVLAERTAQSLAQHVPLQAETKDCTSSSDDDDEDDDKCFDSWNDTTPGITLW